MTRFVGLDVSQKITAICVVDDAGRRLWRGQCPTNPEQISTLVRRYAGDDAHIGIETGAMTPWLVHELRNLSLEVVCLDARHARAALKMQINKTDQNDAESLAAEIQSFYGDLLLEKLRIIRPSKFVFMCGGAIVKTPPNARPENLRDYLWRVRPLRLAHPTVLAEDAFQLFRDSDYDDLISFEEDVARIAAVVLVIAESAGSVGELGAFASNNTIRQVLRVGPELRRARFRAWKNYIYRPPAAPGRQARATPDARPISNHAFGRGQGSRPTGLAGNRAGN
jgi:hypothetical protein